MLADMDALILCGGLGTRFREVSSNIPKVLAPVDDKYTFLDVLLTKLSEAGVRQPILCIGYLGEQVEEYCNKKQLDVQFSREVTPLGTGGAIKNALSLVRSDPFFVLNGDSLCSVSLTRLLDFHFCKQAVVTLTLVEVIDTKEGGSVRIDAKGRLTEFVGKREGPGFLNAGIYVMSPQILQYMPKDKFSFEKDVLPSVCYICFGFVSSSTMLDIGTAERFKGIGYINNYTLL